mgnify:CR=1 FL=1
MIHKPHGSVLVTVGPVDWHRHTTNTLMKHRWDTDLAPLALQEDGPLGL